MFAALIDTHVLRAPLLYSVVSLFPVSKNKNGRLAVGMQKKMGGWWLTSWAVGGWAVVSWSVGRLAVDQLGG
jgi:hypothetical protein